MEKKHKDLLIKNQVFLVEKLDMKKLFDHLLSTRLLANDDKEKLEVNKFYFIFSIHVIVAVFIFQ